MIDKKYDIFDGIFASFFILLLFGGYVLLMNIYFSRYYDSGNMSDIYQIATQTVFCLFFLSILLIYLASRKQKLASIGLTAKNLKKSASIGLIYSGLFTTIIILYRLFTKDIVIEHDFLSILLKVVYFVFYVVLFEEIVFRGFIDSRMSGLIKNKYLSTFIVAIAFSLMHMPFNSLWFQGSVTQYFAQHAFYHIILFLLHPFLKYFYDKYNNIAAPSIFHFTYNIVQWLF